MAVVDSNAYALELHDLLKEEMKDIQESLTRALEGLQKTTSRTKSKGVQPRNPSN